MTQQPQEKAVATEAEFQEFIVSLKSGAIDRVTQILRKVRSDIVNKIETQFRQPSLYFAALAPGDESSFNLMTLLIENGANVAYKDQNQQTVLFYICREGKEKCVQLLLGKGLSLGQIDLYGQTPLFYAASQNRLNILHYFTDKAIINHADKIASQTALFYAARKGHLEMCKLLLEKGSQIAHPDSSGKTVAQFAKKARQNQVAEYLSAELRKSKEASKNQGYSQSIDQSNGEKKRKSNQIAKAVANRLTYKIVYLNEKGESKDLTVEQVRQLLKEKPEFESYLANPETIPTEQSERSQQQGWQKIALKILNLCWKLKGAFWFHQAVDPVKFNIMDYFDIITKPMDLGTIKKRLSHNYYNNARQFSDDMTLVWRNCYRYNGENHQISKAAKEVEVAYEEYVKLHSLTKYF